MVTITFRESDSKRQLLNSLFNGQNTKFNYCIQKALKNMDAAREPILKIYQEKLSDLNNQYCSVDDKGNRIETPVPGQEPKLSFTPENFQKLTADAKAEGDKLNSQEITFNPFYAQVPSVPGFEAVANIMMFNIEELTGILFDPALYDAGQLIIPETPASTENSTTESNINAANTGQVEDTVSERIHSDGVIS